MLILTTKEQIKIKLEHLPQEHGPQILDLSPWDREQLIIRCDTSFFLIPSKCPHQGLPLDSAYIKSNTLTCPWHGCKFPMGLDSNCKGSFLKTITLNVENGYVKLPD